MAGVLSRFSFATATTIQQLKNSSNNENTVKSTAFWLSVWKKWCLVVWCLALWARAILLLFKKIYSCLFIPNCTRNHVITYTNNVHGKITQF